MWGTLIQVAYLPEFTEDLKHFIRKNVKPSLVANNEDSTNQYFIDDINTAMGSIAYSDEDNIIFLAMENEGITYCEF